jgi:hypothetical protein
MTEPRPVTGPGITLDVAVAEARRTLASVADEARQNGYYSGARTGLINAHAELRAALDMLVKAVSHLEPGS